MSQLERLSKFNGYCVAGRAPRVNMLVLAIKNDSSGLFRHMYLRFRQSINMLILVYTTLYSIKITQQLNTKIRVNP